MNIHREISKLKIYDSTYKIFNDTERKYEEYLRALKKLNPEELFLFLNVIKQKEIINTQKIENEDTLFAEMDNLSHSINSIDYLCQLINSNDDFDLENLQLLHSLTIRGTTDDRSENYDYRTVNLKVGKIVNGEEVISYIPPDYEKVISLINEVLEFLNSKNDSETFDSVFLKPIIAHALIAIIQPFANGNTRLARLVHYGKTLSLTNEEYGTSFEMPTFYLSENYRLMRGYRRGIGRLANEFNDDNWNNWFKYNARAIEEQLFYLINHVNKIEELNKKVMVKTNFSTHP